MYKNILKIAGMLLLGALGALVFNVSVLPYFLASTYFENFQFVKDFKQGKIVLHNTDQVYIQENTAIEDAILRVENSVVTIQGNATASGLVVTSDGEIITLASALGATGDTKVFFQGTGVAAKIVTVDAKNNLALLKMDKNNLQTVAFAGSDTIRLGQAVFLVSPTSPAQDNWFANEGIITEIDANKIKTNMKETVTATGSPLFNSAGELIGLNIVDATGAVAAVPVSKIQELLGL